MLNLRKPCFAVKANLHFPRMESKPAYNSLHKEFLEMAVQWDRSLFVLFTKV